jgi:hypothetical protein
VTHLGQPTNLSNLGWFLILNGPSPFELRNPTPKPLDRIFLYQVQSLPLPPFSLHTATSPPSIMAAVKVRHNCHLAAARSSRALRPSLAAHCYLIGHVLWPDLAACLGLFWPCIVASFGHVVHGGALCGARPTLSKLSTANCGGAAAACREHYHFFGSVATVGIALLCRCIVVHTLCEIARLSGT